MSDGYDVLDIMRREEERTVNERLHRESQRLAEGMKERHYEGMEGDVEMS